jgi:hypothetical protein
LTEIGAWIRLYSKEVGLRTFVWVKTMGFQQVGCKVKPEARIWVKAPKGAAVEA